VDSTTSFEQVSTAQQKIVAQGELHYHRQTRNVVAEHASNSRCDTLPVMDRHAISGMMNALIADWLI
jgi:hypothetical protein